MTRSLLFALLSLGLVGSTVASELTDKIRAGAQECADALLNGDYKKLIERTHTRIVQEMGGPEQAVAFVAEGIEAMKADGITMESVTIGDPSEPVAHEAMVAAIVPQNIILNTPKGRFRKEGHLLAISEDGGATWSYMDTGTLNEQMLQDYFPALADQIKLPPKKELQPLGR